MIIADFLDGLRSALNILCKEQMLDFIAELYAFLTVAVRDKEGGCHQEVKGQRWKRQKGRGL